MQITIDPDDTELKDAIRLVETREKQMQQADREWNRDEPSMYMYTAQHDALVRARDKYDAALMTLGNLIVERL